MVQSDMDYINECVGWKSQEFEALEKKTEHLEEMLYELLSVLSPDIDTVETVGTIRTKLCAGPWNKVERKI